MGKDNLSDKEAALIAAARRELLVKAQTPAQNPAQARPGTQTSATPSAPRPTAQRPPVSQSPTPGIAAAKPKMSAAEQMERLALLMGAEREESLRRKKKMRRYGIVIPAAILAVAALWMLKSTRRR